jgi:hypothetical protein
MIPQSAGFMRSSRGSLCKVKCIRSFLRVGIRIEEMSGTLGLLLTLPYEVLPKVWPPVELCFGESVPSTKSYDIGKSTDDI